MCTKEREAARLAEMHYEIESGVTEIFRVTGPGDAEAHPGEPVKLLEVNENTVAAGILPLGFGPAPELGLTSSTIIIEVTPDEFRRLREGDLALPHGWRIGEPIPRPAVAPGR
jgi:hypothetical protein